jgi:hypothetical protein
MSRTAKKRQKTGRKDQKRNASPNAKKGENGTRPEIFQICVDDIKPASMNDMVYGVIDPYDPSLDELANLMEKQGQLEPVVLTLDNVLLSGHRRLGVAKRLLWEHLKARRHPIHSNDPDFERVLVTFNAQRDKSPHIRILEQLVLTDPEGAYENLISERVKKSQVKAETLTLGDGRGRSQITDAKKPFLDAIDRVIYELREYWPLSDRRIHYALLNNPPLLHANKPNSRYKNNKQSYKAVCELLTRARLARIVPFEAIGDETRPVSNWDVHPNVGPFIHRSVGEFCTGYCRNLVQSQPNHIEIVGEKMTVEGIVRPVAARYCIPYTIGRGYSSLPPRKAMFDRYTKSGKSKLLILFLSDHDPEGWGIAETFAKSMRDDFGVEDVEAVKVALKPEQVRQLGLPPNTDAKPSSSRFEKFSAKYGSAAYELEAVPPATLQAWLDESIRSVIDIERFNEQVEEEKRDAATITAFKKASVDYLKTLQPK